MKRKYYLSVMFLWTDNASIVGVNHRDGDMPFTFSASVYLQFRMQTSPHPL